MFVEKNGLLHLCVFTGDVWGLGGLVVICLTANLQRSGQQDQMGGKITPHAPKWETIIPSKVTQTQLRIKIIEHTSSAADISPPHRKYTSAPKLKPNDVRLTTGQYMNLKTIVTSWLFYNCQIRLLVWWGHDLHLQTFCSLPAVTVKHKPTLVKSKYTVKGCFCTVFRA